MKALREVYDFVTGGSIVSPIGAICAIVVVLATSSLDPGLRAAIFLGIIALTLIASTFERVT
ncbi:MAG TPA: hypothetical protein VMS32_06800 [Verrucomicrobiae bacterium]|nr:hypothetical protein [Verrucomicrobiae bacterium]